MSAIPLLPACTDSDLSALVSLVRANSPVCVLTGAGCSTESGIPDYRGPQGTWNRRRPMLYGEFIRNDESRRHYWARNYRGWPIFDAASPNPAHFALARLEEIGAIRCLISQNVDSLHRRAGSRSVIDLHGQSERVVCVDCGEVSPRYELQERMARLNANWKVTTDALNADADAEISREETRSFNLPECRACGGRLKPDVVFFGENVPKERVRDAMTAVETSGALLVAGSSLTVWSGYRFALRAHELGRPIAIVNCGETRADSLAQLRIDARCGDVLPRLVRSLESSLGTQQ